MDEAGTATIESCTREEVKRGLALRVFFSLLLLIGIDGLIANQKGVAATPITEISDSTCIHLGRTISIQGEVLLKRRGWQDYHPTAVGAELCQGDLLQPSKGTRAYVQCVDPDQNLWKVPDGASSSIDNGCHPPKKPIHTIPGPITPTRDPFAHNIPYIITPSHTWLLSDKPKFRWQPVPGATNYVVRLSGPWIKWEQEVSATSVVYPGNPRLKPQEEGYLLTVEPDTEDGEAAKTVFGLLSEQKATRVKAAAKRIFRQNLTDEAKSLALAEVYIGQGLLAEATELLEAAVTKGSKTGAVYYMLGDLYSQVESFRQAEASYLKAVEMATATKDIEGEAVVAARLAQLYTVLGDSDRASGWLKQSKSRYQTLKPVAH